MAWTLAAPLVRQPHDQGLDQVLDVLLRDPLPGADQRVPVLTRTYDRWTVLIPFATRPAHPMYCRFRSGLAGPFPARSRRIG